MFAAKDVDFFLRGGGRLLARDGVRPPKASERLALDGGDLAFQIVQLRVRGVKRAAVFLGAGDLVAAVKIHLAQRALIIL